MNFWARYQGLGVRAHSTSLKRIEGNPWTLIVFHELAQSEAQNAERILLFAALAVAYLIIASAFVLSIPREPITTTWVWPSPTRKGEYLHVILVVVMIVPAFYSLIFKLEQATLILTAAVIIPTLTLTAAIFRLKKRNELVLAVSAILFVVTVFGQVTATPRPAIRMLFLISAILALLSLPHSERWLSQSKKPSTLNVLALLCSVMLMFAGILPCVAFFKVAYDYQASLLTRRWQIQTIEALATREDRVKEQYRSIPLANDKTSGSSEIGDEWLFLRRRLDETADRYDTVAFNLQDRTLSENSIANIRGECEQDVPPSLLATIAGRIPYGKGTVTHSFSQIKESVDGRWRWCREGNSRIRLEPNVQSSNENDSYYNLPATRAFVKATAGDSVFLYPTMVSELPRLGPSWIAAAITFLVAWWLAYKWVRPTLRLMFLEDEDDEDEEVEALPLVALQADTEFNADTILLTADPREASRYFKARPGTYVLDFVDVLRGTSVNYRLINQPLVVIDHFDYQIGTADADTKRLETLEGLRFAKPGGHLALLASTDPKFYFRESNPDAVIESARAVRWSRCLHNFNTVRQTPAESPTDDDYSLIWQASTPAEKAALDQLARDELANPQNWGALEQLQRRDLITGWPLRFKDEKFEKYVRKVASGPERRSWQQLDTSGVWEGIRMTAVVVVLGLLAAIFFFRQQTYLSYIATGLSILTPLSKLLSEARSLPLLLGFGGKKE
jgi:hypothetical protein